MKHLVMKLLIIQARIYPSKMVKWEDKGKMYIKALIMIYGSQGKMCKALGIPKGSLQTYFKYPEKFLEHCDVIRIDGAKKSIPLNIRHFKTCLMRDI
jgi:hypothetical protein